jgi:hypothetical protein
VKQKLPINEPVLLDITRLAEQDSSLGFLKADGDGGKDVCDDADEDHLDVGQNLWKPEEDVEKDGHEFGERSSR